jgi:hypothetical protein
MGTFKLGEALKNFVQGSKLKNGIRSAEIEEVWLELMGGDYCKVYRQNIHIQSEIIYTNKCRPFEE